MGIDFSTNRKDLSLHYPPYAAPWGRATKEPTHVWDDELKRSVPRSGYRCTDGKCPYCTYKHNGVRMRHIDARDVRR